VIKKFCSISGIFFLLFLVTVQLSWKKQKKAREFYQISVYHFKTGSQEKLLDNYFRNGLLPALHRLGVNKIGVFKSWSNDTVPDKLMYVFTPLKSLNDLTDIPVKLQKDKEYNTRAKDFLEAGYKTPPYSRIETIILRAFSQSPQMQLPTLTSTKNERVYELRSYESATETLFQNKVKMFNDGDEISIFKRLNFNAIFYSEVVAGAKMPNLMYMTSFENREDRDSHWKSFGIDSAWKKLSSMPEYQNNVSHIDISFLYPTDYSDF